MNVRCQAKGRAILNGAGFTVIEVMVVVGMLLTMLAIAAPSLISWRKSLEYKNVSRNIMSDLRAAKMRAIEANLQHRVEVQPVPGQCRIVKGNQAYNTPGSGFTQVVRTWTTFPKEVVVRTGACTSASTSELDLVFSPNGTATAGSVCVMDSAPPKFMYRITVSPTGRIMRNYSSVRRSGMKRPPWC